MLDYYKTKQFIARVNRNGEVIGEIDKLVKINGKPVIFESKVRSYQRIAEDTSLNADKIISTKINPIKDALGEDPEFILIAPIEAGSDIAQNALIKTRILDPLKQKGVQTAAVNFPQEIKKFEDKAKWLCARIPGCSGGV